MSSSRTGNRFTIILFLLLAALCALPAADALAEKKVDNLTFDEAAEGIENVSVETINGDIEVAGTETATIHIEAKRTIRGDDSEVVAAYAEEFKPKITRDGKRLMIETEWPDDDRYEDGIDHGSISYVISLPRTLSLESESVNGEIIVDNVYGELSLETVNGDIDIDAATGSNGEISAETVNGEISVDLKALLADGSFETVNGSVEVTIRSELKGGIQSESVNGSVTIELPASAQFSIDAEVGMSGSIKSDWGTGSDDDRMFGEALTVDVNGGGESINVETMNGAIRIQKAKS